MKGLTCIPFDKTETTLKTQKRARYVRKGQVMQTDNAANFIYSYINYSTTGLRYHWWN